MGKIFKKKGPDGKEHSRFTFARQEVITKPAKKVEAAVREVRGVIAENKGLLTTAATVIGAALGGPAGAKMGAFIGSVAGSGLEAAANHSEARHNKKAEEQKLAEQESKKLRELDEQKRQGDEKIRREREELKGEEKKNAQAREDLKHDAAAEQKNIDQKQLVADILDRIVQRRLNELPNLIRQLNDVGRQELGNNHLAAAHADDRQEILGMFIRAQAQPQADAPGPQPQPQPAMA